jgi:hypothetical protein
MRVRALTCSSPIYEEPEDAEEIKHLVELSAATRCWFRATSAMPARSLRRQWLRSAIPTSLSTVGEISDEDYHYWLESGATGVLRLCEKHPDVALHA